MRGVKQRDPLSSLSFNSVLEDIFRKLKGKWRSTRNGIRVSDAESDERLTNLRFADDVMLVASSLDDLALLIGDMIEESRKR